MSKKFIFFVFILFAFFPISLYKPSGIINYSLATIYILRGEPSEEIGERFIPPQFLPCQGNLIEDLGGEIRCMFESGQMVRLVFPSHSIRGTILVKIKPKNKTEVIKINPLPKKTQIVGDLIADFEALSGNRELEKFERPVSITFTYSDKQIQEIKANEKNLKIYFWEKATSSWKALESEVNAIANTVTASTSNFTLFALLAETISPPKSIFRTIQLKLLEIKFKFLELKIKILEIFRGKAPVYFQTQLSQLLEAKGRGEIPKIPFKYLLLIIFIILAVGIIWLIIKRKKRKQSQ
jgi:hypothetical protein